MRTTKPPLPFALPLSIRDWVGLSLLLCVFFVHNTIKAQINTFPHYQNFDAANGGWTSSLPDTWQWGNPNKVYLDDDATGGGNCWVTYLDFNYENNAFWTLETPIIDFSAFPTAASLPILGFDHAFITAGTGNLDGLFIEYTTDGVTWSLLDEPTALQWYNDAANDWWDGTSTAVLGAKWNTSLTSLPAALAGQATVRFRFVLQSNAFTNNEGWAIDNFSLTQEPDAAITQIVSVASGVYVDLTNSETISITIQNQGGGVLTDPTVSYTLSGVNQTVTITETIAGLSLNPLETHTYNFTAPANMIFLGDYLLQVSIDPTANEQNLNNNSLTANITHFNYDVNANCDQTLSFAYYDWDDGTLQGWVADPIPATVIIGDGWEVATPLFPATVTASSPPFALVTNGDGDFARLNNGTSRVTSPTYDLSTYTSDPDFRFKLLVASNNFDVMWVEYSFDNGTTWQYLDQIPLSTNWYNQAASTVGNNLTGGLTANTDHPGGVVPPLSWGGGDGGGGLGYPTWTDVSRPLIGFAGQAQVKLRFVFFSTSTVEGAGWAIDDAVIGCMSADVPTINFTATPQCEGVLLDWTVTNAATATAFSVQRTEDLTGATGWIEIAHTPTNVFSFLDLSAQPDITYRYRIVFEYADGMYDVSTPLNVTVTNPPLDLGADVVACDEHNLQAPAGFAIYEWRKGADLLPNNTRNLTVTETGTYSVRVETAQGCEQTDEIYIEINPTPTLDLGADIEACIDDAPITLTAPTGFASYQWRRNGSLVAGQNGNTLEVSQSGLYRLTIESDAGCSTFDEVQVTINDPNVDLGADVFSCVDVTLTVPSTFATYTWTLPDGTTVTDVNSITATESGLYSLTVTTNGGCSSSDEVNIDISQTTTEISPNTEQNICPGQEITFTATGNADTYSFRRNGIEIGTGTTLTFAPWDDDEIWVVGTVTATGCIAVSEKVKINHYAVPTVDIGVDRFKCVGDTAIIVATMPEPTNFIYDWRKYDFDNDIWAQVGNGNDTLFALDTGWYKVRLQNVTTGCEGFSNAIFLYDYDTLKVDIGKDRYVCDPSDLPFRLVAADLSHPNSVVYEWYETGDNTILGTDSTYDVPQEGFYSVIVKDLLRGCEVRDTVRIQLKPDPDFEIIGHDDFLCGEKDTLYLEVTNIENYLIAWNGVGVETVAANGLSAIVNRSGTYTVTVTDTTFGTICSTSKSVDVNVKPKIILDLEDDEIVACQTDTLRFDAFNFTHEPDYEYLWRNLATAEVVSDNSNVEIVFEDSYTPTRFEIQVTDAAGCQVRDTITVRFERQSQVEILETYAQAACAGETINLTAQGADTYTWSASYGSISGTGANATFSSDSAGIFQIIVKGGFPTGCPESSDTVSVRILNNPTLNLPTEIVLCESDSVTLSAFLPTHQPRYQYEWRDAAGSLLSDSVVYTFSFDKLAEPTYEPQSYQVRVFDEVLGATCEAISEITVRFTRQSQVEIVALDTVTCIGDSIVLQAQGGDSFAWYERNGLVDSLISTQNSVTVSRSKAGLYPYILRGTYEGSVCDSTESIIWLEFVAPPVVSLNQPDTVSICTTDSLLLIASGAVRYEWLHAPNLANDSLTVRPNDTTLYVVKGYNETGCFSYDSVVVLVQPKVELGEPREYCEGERDTLRVLRPQGAEFLWSTGERGDSLVIFRSGTYILTVSIGECSYRDTLEVRYRNLPRLSLKDTTLCFEDSLYGQRVSYQYGVSVLNYDSTATYAYVWQDAEGNIISTDSLVEIGQGGAYQVSVTATYDKGCAAQTAMLIEEVCPPTLYIPDAFSPNADGLNDEWKIFGSYWSNMRIRVYNAWGQLVWYANYRDDKDSVKWWDGTHNGKHVPTGVYLYELTFTPKNAPSRTLVRSGKVSIVK
ncbi:gliding motility-associated C-terminal domain-containing protein [Hugenholtzia roseola]|uniref:T9SS type B sorting domain-containing protein n=1 Tax=Hugenholtzia roseola TaxID=1002 RepID=UPI0012B5BC1F|nr:gliding motility-associated C-terminal domain-containing protein [Hugenholtzia roseola]